MNRKFIASAFAPMLPGLVGMGWYSSTGNPGGGVMLLSYVAFLVLGYPALKLLERNGRVRAPAYVALGAALGFITLMLFVAAIHARALVDVTFWRDAVPGIAVAMSSGALVLFVYWLIAVRGVNVRSRIAVSAVS